MAADTGTLVRSVRSLQATQGNVAVQRMLSVQRDDDEWGIDTPLGSIDVTYDPSTGSVSGNVDTAIGSASGSYNATSGQASGQATGSGIASGYSASGSVNTDTGAASGNVSTPHHAGTGSYDPDTGVISGAGTYGSSSASGSYNTQTGAASGSVSTPMGGMHGSHAPSTGTGVAAPVDHPVSEGLTAGASEAPSGGRARVARGQSGPDVADLQQRLSAAGYQVGTVDGIFGPKTERAVRAFQSASGLAPDGTAGPKTWAALGG